MPITVIASEAVIRYDNETGVEFLINELGTTPAYPPPQDVTIYTEESNVEDGTSAEAWVYVSEGESDFSNLNASNISRVRPGASLVINGFMGNVIGVRATGGSNRVSVHIGVACE